jgi:hypothetical protein
MRINFFWLKIYRFILISILLSTFVLTSLLKRLSIQYVYERVLSFFQLSIHLTCFSKGAKVINFYFHKLKFIWDKFSTPFQLFVIM